MVGFPGEDDADFISFDPEELDAQEAERKEKQTATLVGRYASFKETVLAYKRVFNTPEGEAVIADMRTHAMSDQHFFPDSRVQDVMAGRKQALQRIVEYRDTPVEELAARYSIAQAEGD
jgi:hypothetical protein